MKTKRKQKGVFCCPQVILVLKLGVSYSGVLLTQMMIDAMQQRNRYTENDRPRLE